MIRGTEGAILEILSGLVISGIIIGIGSLLPNYITIYFSIFTIFNIISILKLFEKYEFATGAYIIGWVVGILILYNSNISFGLIEFVIYLGIPIAMLIIKAISLLVKSDRYYY